MHKKVETSSKYTFRQFSSTTGFGNETKLKSKLPPFSLIHVWYQRAFCLRLHSRLHLSKFCYTWTVGLSTLGCFRFHVWDRVLGQLTGNYHRYCDMFSRIHDFLLARLIWRLATLADMGMYGFSSNKSSFVGKVCKFYSQTRGPIDIQTKIAACTFVIQIPPFIDWTCAWEGCGATAEITVCKLWCGSQQRAGTCWIDVQSFCVWWYGHIAYGTRKCNIYTKICNECDPCLWGHP